MNSQTEPSTDPQSGPVGSRAVDPRSQAGQWTSADLLAHYQRFAWRVETILGLDDDLISDRMRLVRITSAHTRLTEDTR
jgi:hypothetical protein